MRSSTVSVWPSSTYRASTAPCVSDADGNQEGPDSHRPGVSGPNHQSSLKTAYFAQSATTPFRLDPIFAMNHDSESTPLLSPPTTRSPLPRFQLFILLWIQLAEPIASQVGPRYDPIS
jgi:hypothetical protein